MGKWHIFVFSAYNKVRWFKIHICLNQFTPFYNRIFSLTFKYQPKLSMNPTVDCVTVSFKWDDNARNGQHWTQKTNRSEFAHTPNMLESLTRTEPTETLRSFLHGFWSRVHLLTVTEACTATKRCQSAREDAAYPRLGTCPQQPSCWIAPSITK